MSAGLSIIVVSKGRPTLMRTIHSVVSQMRPGDQLILDVNADHPQGHVAHNRQLPNVTGDVLLGVADDDYFMPGAFDLVRKRYAENPGQMHIFRMHYSNDTQLWAAKAFVCGNVSPSMAAIPVGPWLSRYGMHYNGDFQFLADTLERMENQEVVWHEEVVQIIELPPCRGGVEH